MLTQPGYHLSPDAESLQQELCQNSGGNASGSSTILPVEGPSCPAEILPPDAGVDVELKVCEPLTVVSGAQQGAVGADSVGHVLYGRRCAVIF